MCCAVINTGVFSLQSDDVFLFPMPTLVTTSLDLISGSTGPSQFQTGGTNQGEDGTLFADRTCLIFPLLHSDLCWQPLWQHVTG